MSNPTYQWLADPGHAWLVVPIEDVRAAEVSTRISKYSFRSGDTCYLEEDCDAYRFLEAIKAKGVTPTFTHKEVRHFNRNRTRFYA